MLTLNIEDESVKITLFNKKRVISVVDVPLSESWVQNGVVLDYDSVCAAINRSLNENHINEKEVVACISATHSIYRVVYVPKLDRRLLAEAARKEMERVSPVPLDTLYTSWKDVKASGGQSALCLLGLPRENVDSVVETVTRCGLLLRALELKPLAVARVVDEKTAIVVNIQLNGFDITILCNGIPELVRSLPFPQTAMSDDEKIALFKDEIERTVEFYNSSRMENQLGRDARCFISGYLARELARVLEYAIRPLPAMMTYPESVDQSRYAANTGLALGIVGGSRILKVKFDVTPQAAPFEVAGSGASRSPIFAAVIAAVLIVVAFILNSAAGINTASLMAQVEDETRLVADTQKIVKEQGDKATGLRDQSRQTLDRLRAPLDYLSKQRSNTNRDIGNIIAALPGVMYITSLHDDGESIVITGLALNGDMALDFARSLQQSGLFSGVDITSINTNTFNETNFVITVITEK